MVLDSSAKLLIKVAVNILKIIIKPSGLFIYRISLVSLITLEEVIILLL